MIFTRQLFEHCVQFLRVAPPGVQAGPGPKVVVTRKGDRGVLRGGGVIKGTLPYPISHPTIKKK